MDSIKDIKFRFVTEDYQELKSLIRQYAGDEREGVKKIVLSARKRLDAINKEIARTESLKTYERQYAMYAE